MAVVSSCPLRCDVQSSSTNETSLSGYIPQPSIAPGGTPIPRPGFPMGARPGPFHPPRPSHPPFGVARREGSLRPGPFGASGGGPLRPQGAWGTVAVNGPRRRPSRFPPTPRPSGLIPEGRGASPSEAGGKAGRRGTRGPGGGLCTAPSGAGDLHPPPSLLERGDRWTALGGVGTASGCGTPQARSSCPPSAGPAVFGRVRLLSRLPPTFPDPGPLGALDAPTGGPRRAPFGGRRGPPEGRGPWGASVPDPEKAGGKEVWRALNLPLGGAPSPGRGGVAPGCPGGGVVRGVRIPRAPSGSTSPPWAGRFESRASDTYVRPNRGSPSPRDRTRKGRRPRTIARGPRPRSPSGPRVSLLPARRSARRPLRGTPFLDEACTLLLPRRRAVGFGPSVVGGPSVPSGPGGCATAGRPSASAGGPGARTGGESPFAAPDPARFRRGPGGSAGGGRVRTAPNLALGPEGPAGRGRVRSEGRRVPRDRGLGVRSMDPGTGQPPSGTKASPSPQRRGHRGSGPEGNPYAPPRSTIRRFPRASVARRGSACRAPCSDRGFRAGVGARGRRLGPFPPPPPGRDAPGGPRGGSAREGRFPLLRKAPLSPSPAGRGRGGVPFPSPPSPAPRGAGAGVRVGVDGSG